MRLLYSLLFYLSTPLVLLHLAFRGLKDAAYLRGWGARFGYPGLAVPGGGVVIHAASVGELNAAEPLIRALLSRDPALPVTVTTFTPTGLQRARALFGGQVAHCFAPLDLPGAVRRFLDQVRPVLLVVMETELWPNLFCQAAQRRIPVVLANARISDRSISRYRRFAALTRLALDQVTRVIAQSGSDQQRFASLGVPAARITCSGNLKFDFELPPGLTEKAAVLRQAWGADRPVLMAASTHADDNQAVLDAFARVLETLPACLLVIAPRHPERFDETVSLAKSRGLKVSRFSHGLSDTPDQQCLVIDAMGELLTFYACCDVAFIGGSFGSVGGHNALEAAALAKPVLFGPNMRNFAEIARLLEAAGAARTVVDPGELARQAVALLQNDQGRLEMGRAGKLLVENNKGALVRTLDEIEAILAPAGETSRAGPV